MRILNAAAALALMTTACGDATGPELLLDPTVRVVHAAPETPRLEVVVEDEARAILEYAEVSDFLNVPGGQRRRVQLRIAGDTVALIALDTTFESERQYTILAAGRAGSVLPILLVDDPAPADSGETRVRIVHAAPTAGTVDVYVTEPGTLLSTEAPDVMSLAFGEASDYMVVDARTYQIRVAMAGGADLLIDLPLVVLSSRRVVTLVIMDTMGSGPPHGLIVLDDDPR